MADGIPIYGAYADNGTLPTNLDECNGHVDSTYPFYHYHLQPNYAYPYLVNCLRGCISKSSGFTPLTSLAATCEAAATQYDYSSLRNSLISTNVVSAAPSSSGYAMFLVAVLILQACILLLWV